MNYFNSLHIKHGINLIHKALEKRNEKRAWDMWVAIYPNMNNQNFIPFSKFYKQQTQQKISTRPTEDILKEAEGIRRSLERR